MRGVLSPVLTPFRKDLSVDLGRLLQHCSWLLSQDVGLAVFGTNSEGPSLSVAEKRGALEHLVQGGIDPKRMMPGTGACALPDAVELSRACASMGCGGVLALPPFYYKDVSDDGLFAFFAEVIERVGDERLRLYLYHIPPVAGVGISNNLIERLLKAYPRSVAGMKDSGGQWAHTEAALKAFGSHGFQVFAGNECFLLRCMRAGGVGCISATANVNPARIHRLYEGWQGADAERQQAALNEARGLFSPFPMIPAMKAALAHFAGDRDWEHVRPPLLPLREDQRRALLDNLSKRGFAIAGIK